MVMLRFLEALGYTCRWVVDWSDHVWTEAFVDGRWVHVDPCEVRVRRCSISCACPALIPSPFLFPFFI